VALLPSQRIEEIRVAWERDLEREFASAPYVRAPVRDSGEDDPRIRVDDIVASRLHRVANEAAAHLGVDAPFDIVLSPKPKRSVNAQLLRGRSPFAIRLIGPVASLLDGAALAALIGHEFGHYLALGPLAQPPSFITDAHERGATKRTVSLAYIASELTADRFSLLACRDLHAMVRLEVAVTLLDAPGALGLREREFLERALATVERDEVGLSPGHDASWIPTELRLHAASLFWHSHLYRELTGDGPGDLDLREADRLLRRLFEARLDRYLHDEPPAPVSSPITGFVSTAKDAVERAGSWTDSLARGVRQQLASPPARAVPTVEPTTPSVRQTDADHAAWEAIQDELAELDPMERRFRELERAAEKEREDKKR
jgi:hypothetical protein